MGMWLLGAFGDKDTMIVEEIAKEHNMYRQDYCGCIYSYQNKNK